MTLKEEMDKAIQEGTTYIPPYKLKEMTKVSSKIIDLLTANMATVAFSYSDMKTVMRIVENVLEQGYNDRKDDAS